MKVIKKYNFILILIFLYSSNGLGRPVGHLNRSPKALFMGDAFTAIADDEFTLFYNPAALGRHSGLSMSLINPKIGVTNALDELDRFKNFPSNDAAAIADRILGLPLHLNIGGQPTIKMQHFGLSLIADITMNLELRNAVHPSLDLQYKYDRGFIMGYAFTFGSGGVKGGKVSGRQTSLGLAVKNTNRQGIDESFDLFGLELLNRIDEGSSDIYEIRKALGYSMGKAWGVDIGAEQTFGFGSSQLNFGLSVLDIGNTQYRRTGGNGKVPSQDMTVNLGTAFTQDLFLIDYTLSLDFHPINQGLPLGRMVHFGMEFGIPFVSVMFGWNGGYISYGVSVEAFFLKLYAGFYGVEIGNHYLEEKNERGLLYLSIFDFSFDT